MPKPRSLTLRNVTREKIARTSWETFLYLPGKLRRYREPMNEANTNITGRKKGAAMIGYVGVDEQVDKDFHRALRRATVHRFRDWVLRRSAHAHVLSFEEARGGLTRWSQVYRV